MIPLLFLGQPEVAGREPRARPFRHTVAYAIVYESALVCLDVADADGVPPISEVVVYGCHLHGVFVGRALFHCHSGLFPDVAAHVVTVGHPFRVLLLAGACICQAALSVGACRGLEAIGAGFYLLGLLYLVFKGLLVVRVYVVKPCNTKYFFLCNIAIFPPQGSPVNGF